MADKTNCALCDNGGRIEEMQNVIDDLLTAIVPIRAWAGRVPDELIFGEDRNKEYGDDMERADEAIKAAKELK